MKVAVVMSREPSYTRNRVILDGLASAGVETVEYTDEGANYPLRFLKVLARFIFHRPKDVDLVFVGFFGQPMVPFISRLTKKPLMLDAFLSAYDTMCFDRARFSPGSVAGRFLRWLDSYSCRRSDAVILETREHIQYFSSTFGVEESKFERVFVGAEDSIFKPMDAREPDGTFEVFYYCTFHPVHGTEYVLRAAGALKGHEDIRFIVVGDGQEREDALRLSRELGLDNVEFITWMPYEQLPGAIAHSDVCLGGHFGSVSKSSRVIAGKSFQFMAMGKPVIAGDNPANRELFEDRKHALLVPMADGDAIAGAVLELKEDRELRETIARNGRELFDRTGRPEVIGAQIAGLMEGMLAGKPSLPDERPQRG